MNCTTEALSLRLQALEVPESLSLSSNDPLLYQKLICWLEDSHIRRLPIALRQAMRSSNFRIALVNYLTLLDAPEANDDLLPTVQWLTDFALNLCYSDAAPIYNTPVDPWQGNMIPTLEGCADDPEVMKQVCMMLKTMGIEQVPESAEEGLNVVADVTESLSRGLGDATMNLSDMPLGFSTGDKAVDTCAKVLRVLQLRRLRDLQDGINDTIGNMQRITANPKTDAKRGKVGR